MCYRYRGGYKFMTILYIILGYMLGAFINSIVFNLLWYVRNHSADSFDLNINSALWPITLPINLGHLIIYKIKGEEG